MQNSSNKPNNPTRFANYTHGLTLLGQKVLETCFKEISYILKDTFNFTNKNNTNILIETVLGIADIFSL